MKLFLLGILINLGLLYAVYLRICAKYGNALIAAGRQEAGLTPDQRQGASELVTQIHRVAATNVTVIEDRIGELRRLVSLADEKIQRMNSLLADLEIQARALQPPTVGGEAAGRLEEVQGLRERGMTAVEIARRLSLPLDEVQLSLDLAERKFAGGR